MAFQRVLFLSALLSCLSGRLEAQRTYAPHSVLASGTWFKLAITEPGVYKIDIPFLNNMGLNTSNLVSSAIRLYGNGGSILSESNASHPPDDLVENAIYVNDGGDGVLNGTDYILFYAGGPDQWIDDPGNNRFRHKKNIYSDSAFYFLSIGGTGLRIPDQNNTGSAGVLVVSYNARYFHELDSVNFLSSGKEWYGEEFSDMPGRTLTRDFSLPGLLNPGNSAMVSVATAARSINAPGKFDIIVDGQPLLQYSIPATGSGAYDPFAKELEQDLVFTANTQDLLLQLKYTPGSFNSQAWLNWLEIQWRKPLQVAASQQLDFRDRNSVGSNTAQFSIAGAGPDLKVWDVTDPLHPVNRLGVLTGNSFNFKNEALQLHEYIAFNSFLTPVAAGRVINQDLHLSTPADYIIVTTDLLKNEAARLAAFHEQNSNLAVKIVTVREIYNEFSSGACDPVAIRDYVKMLYDRALQNGTAGPRYLALFGDASFDYKDRIMGNTNFVPAYENNFSLDPLSTYTSDDFFGFLDDNEDINSASVTNLLDLGIGRIPVKTAAQAKDYVDKVIGYHQQQSFGAWRNNLTFIADDEDQNLHLNDAEAITQAASQVNPLFDIQKIYLDAYHQQTVSGGERYPEVNELVKNRVVNGTLIWNYNGHGSSRRLAEEVLLDESLLNEWDNRNRLPLFITATCDFAPYDNPLAYSLGEDLLLRPGKGAIALMTTTRLVFAFSNKVMNENYLNTALQPNPQGQYKSLGDAVRAAKNFTYQNSADIANNRKFTLLGDPALTLGFPVFNIRAVKINGRDTTQADTLQATEKVMIEAVVTDPAGNILTGFNGTATTTVFDKPQTVNTLGNDPGSLVTGFQVQNNIIYRGRSTVQDGKFTVEFRVPKDLNYQYGKGKMSFYAENGEKEGAGYFNNFIAGGSLFSQENDKEGPEIKAWLNDEKFVNGSISNSHPVLILHLSDSSGINTLGTAIGHDISVTIDNNNDEFYTLNDFFEGEQDNYQKGTVRFQLPVFEPGAHSLQIKAWDVFNNSSSITLDFQVVNDEELIISHVLNYPNPFTTHTQFWFEHNRPGEDLRVDVQIFTVSGKIIKRINKTINTEGYRSCEVEWDGRDDFGARIGRGVYIYSLKVSAPGKKSKTTVEKLVVF